MLFFFFFWADGRQRLINSDLVDTWTEPKELFTVAVPTPILALALLMRHSQSADHLQPMNTVVKENQLHHFSIIYTLFFFLTGCLFLSLFTRFHSTLVPKSSWMMSYNINKLFNSIKINYPTHFFLLIWRISELANWLQLDLHNDSYHFYSSSVTDCLIQLKLII